MLLARKWLKKVISFSITHTTLNFTNTKTEQHSNSPKLTELETAELGQETMPSKGQNMELNLQASDFRLVTS